jgi:hypothetical protein
MVVLSRCRVAGRVVCLLLAGRAAGAGLGVADQAGGHAGGSGRCRGGTLTSRVLIEVLKLKIRTQL